jgi:murine toxin
MKFGPGNHAKVLYVSKGEDDASGLVLIGSDNMYPSSLSEFSFVIEGAEAIKAFREQYWDKLWGYSARLGFTVLANGTVE